MGNTKCPVCEKTSMNLQTDFCPTCGFQRRIFPDGVSGEVQAQENERIAKAKEFYKLYEAAKSAADNADKVQSKLDEANQNLQTKQSELETANQQLQTKQSALDAANQQLLANAAANQQLQAKQLELDAAKRQLQAKHNEWQKVKEANLKLETALEQTKKKLDDAIKNTPTTPRPVQTQIPGPDKKVIGKALFTQAGRSEAVDLYEGGCKVTAPAWTNIRGELFEIKCDNGMYFLRDLSGRMYNRHERKISPLVTVSTKDAFRIGELIIRLSFPKQ